MVTCIPDRRFFVRNKATFEPMGDTYASPGRAVAAFKTSMATCGLDFTGYEVVDTEFHRTVLLKSEETTPRYMTGSVLYALKFEDGTVFGWHLSAALSETAYLRSLLYAEHLGETGGPLPHVVIQDRPETPVEPGKYALQSIRHKWLYMSPRGQVWFGRPGAVERVWKDDPRNWDLRKTVSGSPNKGNYHTPIKHFRMVRGNADGSGFDVLDCYMVS